MFCHEDFFYCKIPIFCPKKRGLKLLYFWGKESYFFPFFLSKRLTACCLVIIHTWSLGGGAYFPYIYIYWWPSTKIVQAVMIRQKIWWLGGSLFSLYIYIGNFKNLLVRNYWISFNINWQECSFGNPLPILFKPLWFVKKTWPPGGKAYFSHISICRKL